jgi:hypothetical protein
MIDSKKNNVSLDAMVDRLGMKDTIEMYEYALLKIPEKKKRLLHYIVSADYFSSRQMAHQLLSSVRLYGTEKLDGLLRQVRFVGTSKVDEAALVLALSDEFDTVSKNISQWLNLHREKID